MSAAVVNFCSLMWILLSKRGLVVGNELQLTLTFQIQSDHLPEERLSLQMLLNFPQSN